MSACYLYCVSSGAYEGRGGAFPPRSIAYFVFTIFCTSAFSSGVGANLSQTGFMALLNSLLLTSSMKVAPAFLAASLEACSFLVHSSM